MFGNKKSIDKDRKSFEAIRKSIEEHRQSIESNRKSVEEIRKSIDLSRKSADKNKNEQETRPSGILKKKPPFPEPEESTTEVNEEKEKKKLTKVNMLLDIIGQHQTQSTQQEEAPGAGLTLSARESIKSKASFMSNNGFDSSQEEELIKITEDVISIGSRRNSRPFSFDSRDSKNVSFKGQRETSKFKEEEEMVKNITSLTRLRPKSVPEDRHSTRSILRHDSISSASSDKDKIRKKTSFSVPKDQEHTSDEEIERFRKRRESLAYFPELQKIEAKEERFSLNTPKKRTSVLKTRSSKDSIDSPSTSEDGSTGSTSPSISSRIATIFGVSKTRSHDFYKQRSEKNRLNRQQFLLHSLEIKKKLNDEDEDDDDDDEYKDLEEFEMYLTKSEIAIVRIHTGYYIEQMRKAKKPKYTFKQKILVFMIDVFCCGCRCMKISS